MGEVGVFHLEDDAVEVPLPLSYEDPSEYKLPWWGGAYWPIEPSSSTLGLVLRMVRMVMVIMVMVMVMTKMVIMPEGATAGAQLLGREGVQ